MFLKISCWTQAPVCICFYVYESRAYWVIDLHLHDNKDIDVILIVSLIIKKGRKQASTGRITNELNKVLFIDDILCFEDAYGRWSLIGIKAISTGKLKIHNTKN